MIQCDPSQMREVERWSTYFFIAMIIFLGWVGYILERHLKDIKRKLGIDND